MKNWLVVANASRARVLEGWGESNGLVHVADYVHPQSRQKGVELDRDRPGHVEGTGHGLGSASYVPRTDPRERERARFARQLADALDAGVAEGRCVGLVLVAPDPFLGRLKDELGERARKAILRTVAADYTTLSDNEVARHLGGT